MLTNARRETNLRHDWGRSSSRRRHVDQVAEHVVIRAVAPSASIGDSDTHRRYSSLFKGLRGRRLQAVTQRQRTAIERFGAHAMQLLEGKP